MKCNTGFFTNQINVSCKEHNWFSSSSNAPHTIIWCINGWSQTQPRAPGNSAAFTEIPLDKQKSCGSGLRIRATF